MREVFEDWYKEVSDEQWDITDYSSTKLKGTVNVKEAGRFLISVAVDSGWRFKVDGEPADALIVGSPVYWGQPNGALLSIVQRMFYSNGAAFAGKPAASVAVCRRGGATAVFQSLNMPFQMMNMPLVTSQYWNIVYGRDPGQAALDKEGLQTMRTLADNMAALLKATGGKPLPPREEPWEPMHFIR